VLQLANPQWASFLSNPERIAGLHLQALHNTYITCWSTEPESVAMWALYSPNKDGIRIRSTVARLKATLAAYQEATSLWKHINHIVGGAELLTWHWELANVNYVNLDDFLDEINNAYAEFGALCTKSAEDNLEWWTAKKGYLMEAQIFTERFGKTFTMDHFLKDSSFSHEKELRGVVHAGIRNELDYEEWKRLNDPLRQLFKSAGPGVLPSYAYAPVADDFIDEVCFDPRMPEYKKQVMKDALSPFDIKLAVSRCFGYLLSEKFSFDPIEGIKRNRLGQDRNGITDG